MGGGIVIFALFMLFFAYIEGEIFKQDRFWDSLKATSPVMRSTFIICYILFAVGLCISVYRKYEINYVSIFELDDRQRVGQYGIWRMAIILFFIWIMFFCFNIMEIIL